MAASALLRCKRRVCAQIAAGQCQSEVGGRSLFAKSRWRVRANATGAFSGRNGKRAYAAPRSWSRRGNDFHFPKAAADELLDAQYTYAFGYRVLYRRR